MSVVPLIACLGASFCGELRDEFHLDLRTARLPPSAIVAVAPSRGSGGIIERGPRGIRIAFHGVKSGFPPLGISPRFRVKGDFEITASYEIVTLEKPKSGYGVSVGLWVMADTPSVDAAYLSRAHRPWDGHVYVAGKGWWNASAQKYEQEQEPFPTRAKAGQLRLERTGSTMHYWVADDEDREFRELWQAEYNEKDLSQIHVGIDTGNSENPIEVRLTDLKIRANGLPFGATRPPDRPWRAWAISAAVGTAAVGFATYRLLSRRKATPTPRSRDVTAKGQPS